MNLESIRIELAALPTAVSVIKRLLDLDEKEKLMVIALMWSCWDARNKANAGEKKRGAPEIVHLTCRLIADINSIQPAVKEKIIRPRRRWTPPPTELLKVNVDGAFFAAGQTGGWGFVVRDHAGIAVLAGAGKLDAVHDALCAEALAVMAALQAS